MHLRALVSLLVLVCACSAAPDTLSGADRDRGVWFLAGAGVFVIALIAAGVFAKLLTPRPSSRTQPAGIGPYRLTVRLGSGSTGTTYSAVRSEDGLPVAVKIAHPHCLDDPSFATRFEHAARAARSLDHEHIVSVVDSGSWRDRPYLVAVLVGGRTLRSRLVEGGRLPLPRALEICRHVASALDHAHTRGVVHGNLSPDNVMLLVDGQAVVTDFGVARFEEAATIADLAMFLTTPTYLAPEVMAGEAADHRRDLYALGLILYEMLVGSLPFAEAPPEQQLAVKTGAWMPEQDALDIAPATVWGLVRDLVAPVPEVRLSSASLVVVRADDLIVRLESLP